MKPIRTPMQEHKPSLKRFLCLALCFCFLCWPEQVLLSEGVTNDSIEENEAAIESVAEETAEDKNKEKHSLSSTELKNISETSTASSTSDSKSDDSNHESTTSSKKQKNADDSAEAVTTASSSDTGNSDSSSDSASKQKPTAAAAPTPEPKKTEAPPKEATDAPSPTSVKTEENAANPPSASVSEEPKATQVPSPVPEETKPTAEKSESTPTPPPVNDESDDSAVEKDTTSVSTRAPGAEKDDSPAKEPTPAPTPIPSTAEPAKATEEAKSTPAPTPAPTPDIVILIKGAVEDEEHFWHLKLKNDSPLTVSWTSGKKADEYEFVLSGETNEQQTLSTNTISIEAGTLASGRYSVQVKAFRKGKEVASSSLALQLTVSGGASKSKSASVSESVKKETDADEPANQSQTPAALTRALGSTQTAEENPDFTQQALEALQKSTATPLPKDPMSKPTATPTKKSTATPTPSPTPRIKLTIEGAAKDKEKIWQLEIKDNSPLTAKWKYTGKADEYEIILTRDKTKTTQKTTAKTLSIESKTLKSGLYKVQVKAFLKGKKVASTSLTLQLTISAAKPTKSKKPTASPTGSPEDEPTPTPSPKPTFPPFHPGRRTSRKSSQANTVFVITPGKPLISTHASGTGDMTLYGTVPLKLDSDTMNILSMGGYALEISRGGETSFRAKLKGDSLTLTATDDGGTWFFTQYALQTLAKSGITSLTFNTAAGDVVIPTDMTLTGSAYGRERASGFVASDFLFELSEYGLYLNVEDRFYTVQNNVLIAYSNN